MFLLFDWDMENFTVTFSKFIDAVFHEYGVSSSFSKKKLFIVFIDSVLFVPK